MDRKFVLTGLGYAILGLVLGIFMAASKNHQQLVTHAHIMLVGFVVSMVYAMMHKLWLKPQISRRLIRWQYWLHQLGAAGLSIGLFVVYGQYLPESVIGPLLGLFSLAVLAAMILMKVMFLRTADQH